MPSATQQAIRDLLIEHGPLTVDEIAERLQLGTRNPKNTVRNAIGQDPVVASASTRRPARYVYLPDALTGATVRLLMPAETPEDGKFEASIEALMLLWPFHELKEATAPALHLAGGPALEVPPDRGGGYYAWSYSDPIMHLPEPFWQWFEEQRRGGADALLIHCTDGKGGRYLVEPFNTSRLDVSAVVAANERLIEFARGAVTAQPTITTEFYAKLFARGAFDGETPPDQVESVLFDHPTGFFRDTFYSIGYRADLTPSQLEIFGDRLRVEGSGRGLLTALTFPTFEFGDLGWPGEGEDFEAEDVLEEEPPEIAPAIRRPEPGETAYQLKVSLAWMPDVWRVIELLGGQTLEDLHLSIQQAFGWDNDHLYAFFLSGKAWDMITRVSTPPGWLKPDYDPPTAAELTLAQAEPKRGRMFLYIFDFGDDLRHEIQVQASFEADPSMDYPRIAVEHGEAPPQYPNAEMWDDAKWVGWDDAPNSEEALEERGPD